MNYFKMSFLLVFALLVFSCSDDDSSSNPDDTALKAGEFKCTIDGAAWSCVNTVAAHNGEGAASVSGTRFINGNIGTESLGITFDNIATGQNTTTITFTLMANINNPTDIQIWVLQNASVNVSKLSDDEVEGTFSATLVGVSSQKTITNAKFRAKFVN
jgi:hypothetical protein